MNDSLLRDANECRWESFTTMCFAPSPHRCFQFPMTFTPDRVEFLLELEDITFRIPLESSSKKAESVHSCLGWLRTSICMTDGNFRDIHHLHCL